MKRFTRQPFLWAIGILFIKLSGCATAVTTKPVVVHPAPPPTVHTQPIESPTHEPEVVVPDVVVEEPARPPNVPLPAYTSAQTTKHPAVLALLSEATRQENSGDLEVAAAKLERALRIEPRNPVLWHHLAAVRLRQGQTQLAISLAQKSNSFAARDTELVARNQRIIEQARPRN